MMILKNRADSEINFENLEDAKNYYMPDLAEFPDAVDYAKDIEMADDLEQLADVLNRYTDNFDNGSEYYTKEI